MRVEATKSAENIYWRMRHAHCDLLARLIGRHVVLRGVVMQEAEGAVRTALMESEQLTLLTDDGPPHRAAMLSTSWQISWNYYDWHEILAQDPDGQASAPGPSRRKASPVERRLSIHPLSYIDIVTLEAGNCAATRGAGANRSGFRRPPEVHVSIDIGFELTFCDGSAYHIALEEDCACGMLLAGPGPVITAPSNRIVRRPIIPAARQTAGNIFHA